ncbi:MAG: CesT family type III secretion system chaperone [Deltaproteobacteria bacterium]|nr:CesT family type III secretion system chaperone [Deltaproteobacteria bacterium]
MFKNAVHSICAAAGWKEPQADGQGRYAFSLEGGLDFTLSSPDGMRLLALAPLLVADDGLDIPIETLEEVLLTASARFARMRSVLSLEEDTGRLTLHAFFALRDAGDKKPVEFMEAFLNDLAFWKAQPALSARREQ